MAAGPLFSLLHRRRHDPRLATVRRILGLELRPETGVGALSLEEMDTIVALGNVLYPTGYASDGPEGHVVQQVTEETVARLSTGVPGYRNEFQQAVRLLNAECLERWGETFAAAPFDRRRALMDDLLGPILRAGNRKRLAMCLLQSGQQRWRLWSHVAAELLSGFYRSALGWRLVGYPEAPGTCSGPVAYQFPPKL